MITKGTTVNGFNFEYDNDLFADWEIMDWFTEVLEIQGKPEEKRTNEDNMTLLRDMYSIIHRLFTREQIANWKETNRDENGKVVPEYMWRDFQKIFLESEDKEVKNS